MRTHERLCTLFVFIVLLLVSAFEFFRLQYGIDFRDEGFYLALPYSFIMGAKPFVTEFALQQTAGLILLPFVKLYSLFFGSTGLVLFFRVLYYAIGLFTGIAVAQSLDKRLHLVLRLAIASLCWLFWPFTIPNLSYNTICIFTFTAGTYLFIGEIFNSKERSSRKMMLAGFLLALCVLSYPLMIFAMVFLALLSYFILNKEGILERLKSALKTLALGFLIPSTLVLILFTYFGWDHIFESLQHHRSLGFQGGGLDKFSIIFQSLIQEHKFSNGGLFSVIFGGILLAFFRKWRPLIPALLVVSVCWFQRMAGPLYLPTYLFLIAPFIVWILRDDKRIINLFFILWGTSFFAGIITSFTSSNGFSNALIGCFVGAIYSIYISVYIIDRSQLWSPIKSLLIAAVVSAPILTCARYEFYSVYGDASPITELPSRVKIGPYAGLKTTELKSQFINLLSKDLDLHTQSKKTILIYDDFPAGYMFTNLAPVGPGIWFYAYKNKKTELREFYADYFKKPEHQPDIILEFKDNRWNFYDGPVVIETDVMTNLAKTLGGYNLLEDRPTYWLWGR